MTSSGRSTSVRSLRIRSLRIRLATTEDAAAMLAIYAPAVRATAISFELEPPSVEEFGWQWHDVG